MKGKIIITCFLFCFSLVSSFAQNGYKVIYNRIKHVPAIKKNVQDSTTWLEANSMNYILYCNDSMAYSLVSFPGSSEPYSKSETTFGKKIFHHSMVFERNSGFSYHYSAQYSKRKAKLIRRKEKWNEFIIRDSNVVVNGMRCYAGIYVLNGKDTVNAVIARDISLPYGPFAFQGLPGLVIKLHWPKNNMLIKMESIERREVKIELPKIKIVD